MVQDFVDNLEALTLITVVAAGLGVNNQLTICLDIFVGDYRTVKPKPLAKW